jgi:hypothetical protein
MSILTKYINIPVFIVSFAFGIFAVYVTLPDTKRILVYPSPDNIGLVQYKDKANNCFRFRETSVSCPKDKKKTSITIPVQP